MTAEAKPEQPQQPIFPRVNEIAPFLPPDAVPAVELALARWENAQLRGLLQSQAPPTEQEPNA